MKSANNSLMINSKLILPLSVVAFAFGLGLTGPGTALGQFSSDVTITGNATAAGNVTFQLVDAANVVVQTTTFPVAMGDTPSNTSAQVISGLTGGGVVTGLSDNMGSFVILSSAELKCLVCLGPGPCSATTDRIIGQATRTRLGQIWSKTISTPTVSEWGVAVMALLVLLGGTIAVRQQRKDTVVR